MLRIVPCKQRAARAYVARFHRHHKPSRGSVFCLAIADGEDVVRGVAMAGRPVGFIMDDGLTIEVNRVATDGVRNGCSMLLGACRRVAFAMGYARIITYTLPAEGGASLRACGWRQEGATRGASWSTKGRPRSDGAQVLGSKLRWICEQDRPLRRLVWPDAEASQPTLWGA
jgi:hypothetical protein